MVLSEGGKLLAEVGERATDLCESLASINASSSTASSLLARFGQLSRQLALLHECASDGILNQHLVVPHELTAEMSTIPSLLSTRLDKQHEDQLARIGEDAAQAATGMLSSEESEEYNRRLSNAHKHLIEAVAQARGESGTASSHPPANPVRAPAVKAEIPEEAKQLFAALKTGEGLRKRQKTA